MIDPQTLNQARALLARLELVSHGRSMRWEQSRGGGEALFPPGGITRDDDRGGQFREPGWVLRSHLHYRRRLAGVRTQEQLVAVVADMEASLRAWTHSARPPVDSLAWREKLGRLAAACTERGDRAKLAREWCVSSQRLYQLEQDFRRLQRDNEAA